MLEERNPYTETEEGRREYYRHGESKRGLVTTIDRKREGLKTAGKIERKDQKTGRRKDYKYSWRRVKEILEKSRREEE